MIEPHPAHRTVNGTQDGVQPMITLLQALVEEQAKITEAQVQILGMVGRIITAIEAQAPPAPKAATPEPVKPKIATYEQMYGPILPDPEPLWKPLPPPRRRRFWQRWLLREDPS